MDWLGIASLLVVPVVGWLSRKLIRSNRDMTRSVILTNIAEDVARLLLLNNPNASVQFLVERVIEALRQQGVTSNAVVLSRVAGAAVQKVRVARD